MALRPGVTGAAAAALDEVLGPPPEVREFDADGIVLALAQAVWVDQRREVLADLGIDVRKLDFSDPTAPEGAPASSATVSVNAVSARTGASLTAVTVTSTTSVALENAVMPPLLEVSAKPPFTPLLWSQPRMVSAAGELPL